jgi:aryl-alcohol dehydrogenase-like predicted oxidoreductase
MTRQHKPANAFLSEPSLSSEQWLSSGSSSWFMAQGNDIILIPGNKTRRHLEENVKAIEVRLTQEDLARLDKIFPAGAAAASRTRDMHRVNV